MKKLLLIIFLLFTNLFCNAQTDTVFWFAAPDIDNNFVTACGSAFDAEIYLRLTTGNQPSIITVSQPSGTMYPYTLSIPANSTKSIKLDSIKALLEIAPANTITNQGLKISSSSKISAYYELANACNPEIFVLKGQNALGTNFLISSQTLLDNIWNGINMKSMFTIVSIKDNNIITINPSHDIVGHIANIPFTITLNKGQTYAAVASSSSATNHLQGSTISSNFPIAITLSDDLLNGAPFGGCGDLAGDQTIPINQIGNEYVAIRGQLFAPYDKVYLMATLNGTNIFKDGIALTTLNAGETFETTISNLNTYINGNLPFYAYQLTGIGCEAASAILPKLTCSGSSNVSFVKSTNSNIYANLLVKSSGINNFLINNVSGIINGSAFTAVPGTSNQWYTATINLNSYSIDSVIKISNTSTIFQLGVLQNGGTTNAGGASFGYFSDFNTITATATAYPSTTVCNNSTVTLHADTVAGATYSWAGPNGFTSTAQNPMLTNFTSSMSGDYILTVSLGTCGNFYDTVHLQNAVCCPLPFWSETFDPAPQAGWSIDVANGANDPNHGVWAVNGSEGGQAPGNCCWTTGNNTLHVEVQNAGSGLGDNNGAYYVGGFSLNTNRKSITPSISTIGKSSINLNFDYIEGGNNTTDNFYVEYSTDGGTTWQALANPATSSDVNCTPAYEWANFNVVLPPACDNISNLKIAFIWQYTSGNIGTDLSCAVNNITLSGMQAIAPLNANATPTFICAGTTAYLHADTITNTTYAWAGPNGYTSILQNPTITNCTLANNGTYTVTATVSNCGVVVDSVVINIKSINILNNDTTICAGNSILLTAQAQGLQGIQACTSTALPINLQNGLLAYYPFCGNANDASGNGHNGTVNGATLSADRFGVANQAYSFVPANNARIITNYISTASNNFTFSVWVNSNQANALPPEGVDLFASGQLSYSSNGQCVIHPTHGASFGSVNQDAGAGLYVGNNGVFVIEHSDNFVRCALSSAITLYGWHLVTVKYVNKQPQLFIDGIFIKNGIAGTRDIFPGMGYDNNTYANYTNSGFGCGFNSTSNTSTTFFNGYLDDLMFWNHPLTATEISQLYNLSSTSQTPTSLLWSNTSSTDTTTVTPTTTSTYYCSITDGVNSCVDSVKVSTQVCNTDTCRTNKILLNTGADEITGVLYSIGTQDSNWLITRIQNTIPAAGFSLPYHPFTISPHFAWYVPTYSRWLNRINTYNDADGPLDTHIEYTRHFTTLTDDTFKVKLNFSADNFIDYFNIDGITYFTAPMSSCSSNCCFCGLIPAINDSIIFLTAGCHDITVSYGDYYGGNISANPAGLLLEGYIETINNDSSILKKQCNTNTPPTLTATNTINYCANCQYISPNLSITSGTGCGNLDTVKVYFTKGYVQGADTLQFVPQLGINSYFTAASGVLTLYGNANYGVWETVLKTVCYKHLNNTDTTSIKNIALVLGSALYNPANRHFYKLVNNGSAISWHDAKYAAAASTYFGQQGYLVTITDSIENNFLANLIQSYSWLGASDSAVEGVWRWVTGCEGLEDGGQGRQFSNQLSNCNVNGTGQSINGNYVNWNTNEPNNGSPNCNEDYAHFLTNPLGKWNDYDGTINYPVLSYIIEYGCMPNDPIVNISGNVLINILPKKDTIINKTICQGASYLGYQFAGIYKDTFATNVCDSVRTLNVEATYCPPCGTIINESFDSTNALSNWSVSYAGTGGTAIINNGALKVNVNGGSNGYMGAADIVYLTPNYSALSNLVNKEIYYNLKEIALDSFANNKQNLNAGSYIYNDANNWMRVFVFGKYYPYDFGNPYAGTYLNNWTGHVVGILKSVGGVLTMNFIDTLGFNNLYNLDFLLINNGLNWQLKYKKSNQLIYTTYPTNLPVISTSTFSYRFQSGDGGYTYQNGFGTWQIHNFVVASHQTDTIINKTICTGTSFFGYNATGTYKDTFVNANGCDSVRTINLTVNPRTYSTFTNTICQGQNYMGYTTTGIYIDTLVNANGCDSVRTINLTVTPRTYKTINQSICQGATYLGYTTTGIYIDTLLNANGCDSIRTIHLTVNPKTYSTFTNTICQGQSYLGYTTNGIKKDTFVNAQGCDSVRTINLTVIPKTYSSFTNTICQGTLYLGYNATGTYKDTFVNANGCDSVRTINLTVNPRTYSTFTNTICQGQNYLGYTTSGIKKDTFVNANGCDSVRTLNLTVIPKTYSTFTNTICQGQSYLGYTTSGIKKDTFVNANGCDSVRTLNLTVIPKTYSTFTNSICQGQTYLGYNSTGIYLDTFANANGCDSVRTINLIVHPKTYSTFTNTICQGSSYLGYNATGIYLDTFQNQFGCDSVRTINLTVHPKTYSTFTNTICQGQNYLGYTTSGIKKDTFVNANGCDSVRTLNLTVIPKTYSTFTNTICQGQTYLGYNSTGIYLDTFVNANGCDSVRTINLTVHPKTYSTFTNTICQGQNYLGYTTSGIKKDTFVNANGCDSVRTLNLTVNPKTYKNLTANICTGQSYLGYFTTGVFIDTFINSKGCDSIRTINLTVHPPTSSTINKTICQGQTYLGHSTSGTYIDTITNIAGCDSVRTLNLIVNAKTYSTFNQTICQPNTYFGYSATGTYTNMFVNANGCDSVRSLNLVVNPMKQFTINKEICKGSNYLGYTNTGTFIDTFKTYLGCDSIRTINLIVHPTFVIDTTVHICAGQYYFVAGANQNTSGVYFDNIVSQFGCDSFTKTTLIVHPIEKPNLGVDTSFCLGESITIFPGWFAHYLWNDGDSVGTKTINKAGTYILQSTNHIPCYGYDTIVTTINPSPEINILISKTDFCNGDSVFVIGEGALNYQWYQTQNMIATSTNNPYSFVVQGETYLTLIGSNQYNCKDTSTQTINSIDCCGTLFIPSVFSPNGDGKNDYFLTQGDFISEQFNLKIFNRFGEVVFESNSRNVGWDGYFKGKACDLGTYNYLIQTKCFENKKVYNFKGDVLLVR